MSAANVIPVRFLCDVVGLPILGRRSAGTTAVLVDLDPDMVADWERQKIIQRVKPAEAIAGKPAPRNSPGSAPPPDQDGPNAAEAGVIGQNTIGR